jgi:hypothetical protein
LIPALALSKVLPTHCYHDISEIGATCFLIRKLISDAIEELFFIHKVPENTETDTVVV